MRTRLRLLRASDPAEPVPSPSDLQSAVAESICEGGGGDGMVEGSATSEAKPLDVERSTSWVTSESAARESVVEGGKLEASGEGGSVEVDDLIEETMEAWEDHKDAVNQQASRECRLVDEDNCINRTMEVEVWEDHKGAGDDEPLDVDEIMGEVEVPDAHNAMKGNIEGDDQEFAEEKAMVIACDYDQEVVMEEVYDGSNRGSGAGEAKTLMSTSCVAWRTRSGWGSQKRLSYTPYFQLIIDDSEDDSIGEEEEGAHGDGSSPVTDNVNVKNNDTVIGDAQEQCHGQGEVLQTLVKEFLAVDAAVLANEEKVQGDDNVEVERSDTVVGDGQEGWQEEGALVVKEFSGADSDAPLINEKVNEADNAEVDGQEGGQEEDDTLHALVAKEFLGLDMPLMVINDKGDGEDAKQDGDVNVSQPTQSDFNSELDDEKHKFGTESNPYQLAVAAPESGSELSSSVGDHFDGSNKILTDWKEGRLRTRRKLFESESDECDSDWEDEMYSCRDQDKDDCDNAAQMWKKRLQSESGSSDSSQSEFEEEDEMHSGRDRVTKGSYKGNAARTGWRDGRVRDRAQSSTSRERKRVKMHNAQSLFRLLNYTFCSDKKKHPKDELFPDNEDPPSWQSQQIQDFAYPLIFTFGDDNSEPAENLEHENTLKESWDDFNFAIESKNIGTYSNNEGQAEMGNALYTCVYPHILCSQQKHHYVIDERIGIICKFCSFVHLEIRYVLPSLATSFGEKPIWRNYPKFKNSFIYEELCERAENNDGQADDACQNGTVWDLIPGIITTMYEHQREAFEFMWTNLAGGINLEEFKSGARSDVVGGCVICHAPGTGKTRLAIVFIQTYLKVFPESRPVIIAPRGMLFAWEEEFRKWNIKLPFHILNSGEYSGNEDKGILKLLRRETRTEKVTRIVKLLSWVKGSSILGISYGLFTKLTSEKPDSPDDMKVRSILLEKPGLLVLDEGHTPRNERSVIWKILGKVTTEKRIILSGTPFQNNFLELYNILCLVRPMFAEKIVKKRPRIYHKKGSISEEGKGVWASLTSHVTDDNAEKVRSLLKPFVHIHNGNILQTLPGLRESVIVLNPFPLQKCIIKKMESIGSSNTFENEYKISLASIHPSLVTAVNMSEEEALFLDIPMLDNIRSNPYEGVKTSFVTEVVRLCEALKEKVLIFSQYIQPLALIKKHLMKLFSWSEGKEILQMDGKILPRNRQASIDVFNDAESEARVLLASTRACCEGISLTGASRVVLLDVVWNPAVGRQAISRAYRIGQQKFVYTYNLITSGTSEIDKYNRQAEKEHLSKLVFSPETDFNNVRNTLSKAEEEHSFRLICEDMVLDEMTSHYRFQDMFMKIYYPPTESNIVYTYNQLAPETN